MEISITKSLKNGKKLSIIVTDDINGYHFVSANLNNAEVATASFKLKKRACYINRIELKSEQLSHCGICSKILSLIENIALSNGCYEVNGKFYPFGSLGEHAKAFYIKNGYEIYKDGYETYIFKQLSKNTVTEK